MALILVLERAHENLAGEPVVWHHSDFQGYPGLMVCDHPLQSTGLLTHSTQRPHDNF